MLQLIFSIGTVKININKKLYDLIDHNQYPMFKGTVVLCGGTVIRWYGTVIRWSGGTVVLWYGGAVVRWYGSTAARWYGGTVVRWYGCTVGRWASLGVYILTYCFTVRYGAVVRRRGGHPLAFPVYSYTGWWFMVVR